MLAHCENERYPMCTCICDGLSVLSYILDKPATVPPDLLSPLAHKNGQKEERKSAKLRFKSCPSHADFSKKGYGQIQEHVLKTPTQFLHHFHFYSVVGMQCMMDHPCLPNY